MLTRGVNPEILTVRKLGLMLTATRQTDCRKTMLPAVALIQMNPPVLTSARWVRFCCPLLPVGGDCTQRAFLRPGAGSHIAMFIGAMLAWGTHIPVAPSVRSRFPSGIRVYPEYVTPFRADPQ